MKIALVQMEIKEHDLDGNTQHGLELMEKAARDNDLVVLPEIWNTGYSLGHIKDEALTLSASLFKQIRKTAVKYHCAVAAGSIPVRLGDLIYNMSLVFNEQGELVNQYAKAHLFRMFHEEKIFAPGHDFPVFTWQGLTCGSTICYDLRFPELYRRLVLDGAQLILTPAEWPVERGAVWDLLLRARAVENHIFMAGVNCVGIFKGTHFYGHSQLIAPDGTIMAVGGSGEEIIQAELKPELVLQVRKRLDFLQDIRPDLLPYAEGKI